MNKLLTLAYPYIRLGRYDRPIGGWLFFWPASYGVLLSSNYGFFDPFLMGGTLVSSFMIRAACCAANDIFDRNLDRQIERTKNRPIASGEITPAQGWAYYLLNLAPIPAMLFTCPPSAIPAICTTVPLITLYPLAKRYLKHPQFFLGVTINYGIVTSYAYNVGYFDLNMLPFIGGMWFWTVLYDTVYAFQDLKGDKEVGNNSTAVAWEGKENLMFRGLTFGMATSFAYGGYLAQLGFHFYPALALAIWKFIKSWNRIDVNDPKACAQSFLENREIGAYLFLAILLGKLSQDRKEEKIEKNE